MSGTEIGAFVIVIFIDILKYIYDHIGVIVITGIIYYVLSRLGKIADNTETLASNSCSCSCSCTCTTYYGDDD